MAEFYAEIIKFDSNLYGRIGGNAPECLLEEISDKFSFYACLPDPLGNGYFSIFLPRDFDLLLSQKIYPDCSILIKQHTFSPQSRDTRHADANLNVMSIMPFAPLEADYYEIIRQNEANFLTSEHSGEKYEEITQYSHFIVIGKQPCLVQDEEYYYENLVRDGWEFFAQLDEACYPDELVCGSYPLCFGALYLYRKDSKIIAGFWQNS